MYVRTQLYKIYWQGVLGGEQMSQIKIMKIHTLRIIQASKSYVCIIEHKYCVLHISDFS